MPIESSHSITLPPLRRTGSVQIPSSKSQLHRLLIAAALGQAPTTVCYRGLSQDITATLRCLTALGAKLERMDEQALTLSPLQSTVSEPCLLPCGESGSTLRFLLPFVGAFGKTASFLPEGRLPNRPIEPLCEVLSQHGMALHWEGSQLHASGQLRAGDFALAGNISSQYFSALLMALPLLTGDSTLRITTALESAPYLRMTEELLVQSGIRFEKTVQGYHIYGGQVYSLPPSVQAEGDFSNAAFFLCAGALSQDGITVQGLSSHSTQGDRAILELLPAMGAELLYSAEGVTVRRGKLHGIPIDASAIPDLIPPLSALAILAEGDTHILHAGRLRLKESDRLRSITQLLQALGGTVEELPDGLVIHGQPDGLRGGTVEAYGDHRIAMAAAVASCGCREAVTVQGMECVQKSYPAFWQDFLALKGASL